MNKNKYIILAFVLTFSISCTNDFVDVVSKDANSETFFNNEKEYQDGLIAAYDILQATYVNVMLGEIASDNTLAGGESATDVPGFQEIDLMIHTPNNSNLRDIWKWMYAGLNRANYIMEFKDKTNFANKNQVLGETRFLRAYYSFELVKWFGDIPYLVDKRLLYGDQFNVNRIPKNKVYETIEADLLFAEENLSPTASEIGRATKGAAQALLGKAYLYQKKYTEAADMLDKVINEGNYSLVTDYRTIFENDNENNSESIFEVQYSDAEGAGFECLQCSEGNVAVGFNGIRNYNGPTFDSGFSFNVPTKEVFDKFTAGDSRKNVAILDIVAWATANNATYDEGYKHTGYFNRKYIARKGDKNTGDQNLTNPNNYRAIRLADVLLMAAEAHNKKNSPNDSKALEYLNLVRTRAALTPLAGISGQDVLNAIYDDRRLELVGEGHRFFDLVRTDRAKDTITGFIEGKHEVFPIPLIEIQLAGSRWNQNPGY